MNPTVLASWEIFTCVLLLKGTSLYIVIGKEVVVRMAIESGFEP